MCDANDLRKAMKDASGEKRYYYDMAQRLTKVEQGPQGFVIGTDHNYVLEYAWNAASQVTQKKVTLRGVSAKTWDYTYTDDGQLARVTNPDGEATDHDYLSDGRLKKITLRATDLTGKTTREVFYQDTSNTHDYVFGKMPYLRRTLDKKESGTVITDFEYELDKAGIRLSMKDSGGKYWAFTYDPRYQLRSETKWSAKTGGTRNYQYAWLYDPNGNRLTQHDDGVPTDYVYGANNQMTDAGAVDFTYDHFGNTKTKVEGGNTTTYNWDDEGHLTGVDFPGTTNDDEHQYDGDGKRMRSKLAGASDWTNFVHDELTGEILMEYTLVGGTFTIKAVNTWGLGLISTNREGTKRYFHFDALGSTRALTDSSETVTDTYEYNAFGVVESSSGTSVNPYRYVGQYGYYDDGAMGSSSGFVFTGRSYYSPDYARRLSRSGGGANPYLLRGATVGTPPVKIPSIPTPPSRPPVVQPGQSTPPVRGPGVVRGVVGRAGIIGAGAVAAWDLADYVRTGEARGPFTSIGQAIGDALFPMPDSPPTTAPGRPGEAGAPAFAPVTEAELPHERSFPPGRRYRNCRQAFMACVSQTGGGRDFGSACLYCYLRCLRVGMPAWLDDDCRFWEWE